MAEVLLRDRLGRRGMPGEISSAGLVSKGVPASDGSVRAMAKRGLDLSSHRSTPLTKQAVETSHLVIGMAREHVREAVVLVPDAFERTFTLRELVRRAEAADPPSGDVAHDAEALQTWLAELGDGRRAVDLVGDSPDDDVADPMGRSRRVYERTAAELEDLVDRFVAIADPAPARADSV